MKKASAPLICLAGMDGTGKTTQAQELVRRCRAAGLNAGYLWARWEPFFLRAAVELFFKRRRLAGRAGRDFAESTALKRRLLRRPWLNRAWDRLSLLDYWLSKRWRVQRARRRWDVVVCDRYVYDFAIDQALNSGRAPEAMLQDLERRIFRFFPRPARTLVLTLAPEEGARRKLDGTGVEYLQARDGYYRALLAMPEAVEIEASGPIAGVHATIWERVAPALGGAQRGEA